MALLEARGVEKGFFGNPVLKGVSIALLPGRVHALLGENGAGKSTLINLLSGALQPDSGTVAVEGRPVSRFSPAAARAAGIAVVQQELSLAGELSIAENIGAGAWPRRWGLIDYAALQRGAAEVCAMVGLTEPLDMPVSRLALGRRQMVEIAKAIFRRPKVLILDEPTSSLSAHEAGVLAGLIGTLSRQGVAILYISHRLNEVQALCSHVTVLKDGVVTSDQSLAGVSGEGLVRLMVGRETGDLFPPRPVQGQVPNVGVPAAEAAQDPNSDTDSGLAPALAAPTAQRGALCLRVEGFAAGMVRDLDLAGHAGEILGIGGLVGQGQEDLLLGLYGAIPARATRAEVAGRPGLPGDVRAAIRLGMVYVPADRKHEGLVLTHSIARNLVLPSLGRLGRKGFRAPLAERSLVGDLAARLSIRGDTARPVQALSGGNQQKVALAKWLPLGPGILLLNDPTRGVDIETKREIYLMLRRFAAEGQLVVLLSSDTPELVNLCDRVLVLREGRAVASLAGAEITEAAIVGAAMGLDHAPSARPGAGEGGTGDASAGPMPANAGDSTGRGHAQSAVGGTPRAATGRSESPT